MMNGMFTDRVKKVMQIAREESVRLGNDYVGTEHLLLGLVKEGDGVAVAVMRSMGVDLDELTASIEKTITSTGGMMTIGQMLPFTPRAKKVLEIAANEARSMSHKYIGTEHLLLALMKDTESAAANALAAAGLEYERVKEEINKVLRGGESVGASKEKSKTPFLDHFGRDLTSMAREAKLETVIGREKEIERVVQILSRRKKNNPVLIGEPGIGKTAIVEGLAQKIVEKNIPQVLENKRVINLDMASMVAGTKYRGQFEERLKALMTELQKNDNVIIFIDELHTIVGAGGSEGSLDASNIFKPALARGEIQCVGATTVDEYRKYIEKDAALERRFQKILVEPPSAEESITILQGLQKKYEEHHKVSYTEDAIKATVLLSERYMNERFLPDKAIDVLDVAGARVRLSSMAMPLDLRDKEYELEEIIRKKDEAAIAEDFQTAGTQRELEENLRKHIEEMKAAWLEKRKEENLVVSEDEIRDVISQMTGIPISRLASEETKKLLNLEVEIQRRIVGQDSAVMAIAKSIRRSRAGIHDTKRPMGSFLFLGPTGVGKTELAKVLSVALFGTEDSMIRIDMSEYMEKHSVSRLIGAPPGYVGYEEGGGQLTEKIRKHPYSVVLLDEIEKAHSDVYNLLLQILDDGQLTDSFGRRINFKNTIVIMTSNVGAREVKYSSGMGFTKESSENDYERMQSAIREEVKRVFTPEFLNRIDDQIVFKMLEKPNLVTIVDILLSFLQKNVSGRGILSEVSQKAKEFIVDKNSDPTRGARPLRRGIQQMVEDEIAEGLLMGRYKDFSTIVVGVEEDKLTFKSESLSSDLN